LIGQHRFDDRVGAVAARRHQFVRFGFHQETLRFPDRRRFFAGIETIHTLIVSGRQIVDFSIQGKNIDRHQVMPLARLDNH
jgi:hypothetical protein